MTIYIDNNFKCHLENNGTMREVETDFFDGKCRQFVEGYRFVPFGETWVREDGLEFTGEMIAPWRDYNLLKEFQSQYEQFQFELDSTLTQIETALEVPDDD